MADLMHTLTPTGLLALHWPIQFEYWNWSIAGAFAAAGAAVVWMGMRSLAGLGPVRKWVAIGFRLGVLALLLAIVSGVRWTRQHKDLELIVARDISLSASQFKAYPPPTFEDAWRKYLKQMSAAGHKKPEDRVGEIVFNEVPLIESLPNRELVTEAAPTRDRKLENQTDPAAALELALATFRPGAMHRLLLVWDGVATQGNVDAVVSRAKAMGIPIDVMPLRYSITNEVMMERFVAPTWRREDEPFTIEVFVRSTNIQDVTGKLEVELDGKRLQIGDPANPAFRVVTLKPGLNRFPITVPGMKPGVKVFKARFDGQDVQAGVGGAPGTGTAPAPGTGTGTGTTPTAGRSASDTLADNNVAEGFTVIKGKGKVLYVDNALDDAGQPGPGRLLADALDKEGITLETRAMNQFPDNPIGLQEFDAVILANVPYGMGGLNLEQGRTLARYVHDMGGGLVMIGGKDAFGAGGWQACAPVEEILPVNMDIPAQRQMPKGALVLIMHSCEMPNGNYFGKQCAMAAVQTLSDRDEIGVLSYGGGGGGVGGAGWDFPLNQKGDGMKVNAAIKQMALGDMPDFNDAVDLAVNGTGPGAPCLANSDARQKHIIVISDGDPRPPTVSRAGKNLYKQLQDLNITISTVTVYPHQLGTGGVPPTMKEMADVTKGRFYGPIENNPNQLPQIFIKEATVVRRSLIFEKDPIPVKSARSSSDLTRGMGPPPHLRGMVLTSRKQNPQIEIPLTAGDNNDPVLAHWQTGLGKAVAFMGDATNRWGAYWAASGSYGKFWAQAVRYVSRPPMSTDFDIRVTQDGTRGKITVEAVNKDAGFINFLVMKGIIVQPDLKTREVRLTQVGPGVYTAEFDARDPGNYIAMLNYTGAGNQKGLLMGGLSQNTNPETRELQSNDGLLQQIAARTGGRVLEPFDTMADLFSRQNMPVASSPLPVWDVLVPFLLALILMDVAVRRIAWDWLTTKRTAAAVAGWVRSFTTTRQVGEKEAQQTLGSLKQVRQSVAEQKFKSGADAGAGTGTGTGAAAPSPRPDPRAKFEARQGVAGDTTSVLGGATNTPVPPAPKGKVTPKGQQGEAPGSTMGGLMAAKRRAQDKIREREQE